MPFSILRCTEDLWLKGIEQRAFVIQFLKQYSEKILKYALNCNPVSLKYIKKEFQSDVIINFALSKDATMKKYIQ